MNERVLAHLCLPGVDGTLEQSLKTFAAQTAFTISSSRLPDMPLVYVSSEFCRMTGYSKKEVLGRNCRFLQGPGTSRQSVQEIRNAIQEDRGCTVCLMNYTKDRKPFWNQLCLAPVCDASGVAYYLGIQTNVTGAVLAYKSQKFSPFNTGEAGPHGGVHSFEGCPEIVATEEKQAQTLGRTIQRWCSEKTLARLQAPTDFRPVSCTSLPASLLTPLYKLQQSFVLADPKLPDMPIVHASEGFLRLTGRPRDQVVGHNCRFMQGPQTDREEVARLRQAIKESRPTTVRLLNYRQDGTVFWNNLHVAPIRDADGQVVFFVGCQLDITLTSDQAPPKTETADSQQALPAASETEQSSVAKQTAPTSKAQAAEIEQQDPSEVERTHVDTASQQGKVEEKEALPEAIQVVSPSSKQRQRSVVGTVRVVCRSLSTKTGLRRSLEDQHRPHGPEDNIPQVAQPRETLYGVSRLDMPTLRSDPL